MTLGPEFVRGLRAALSGRLPWRIHKAEGGDSWVALKLGHDDLWLLFSWDSRTRGCCLADGGSVSALQKDAPARTPLVEALRSHFVKGDLTAARQINHDRILEFEIRRKMPCFNSARFERFRTH